jgi:hypothetical protein
VDRETRLPNRFNGFRFPHSSLYSSRFLRLNSPAMDSPSQPPEMPSASPAPKRRSKLRLFLTVAGVLLLALLLLVMLATPTDENLVWLSPAQLNQAIGPRPLPKIRQLVRTWAGPVIRWFRGNPPNIHLSYNEYAFSSNAVEPASLGLPIATNAAGLRAWIPSKTDVARFRLTLEAPGRIEWGTGAPLASMNTLRVIVQSGRQAQLQQGNSVPVITSVPAGKPGSITFVPVGMMLNMIPTYSSGSFKLLMGAESTEIDALRSTNHTVIKTNFSIALRVTVPGTNGLLLQYRNPKDPGAKTYWLIAVPTALDAQGKPIKP